jgi:hypothetical protein
MLQPRRAAALDAGFELHRGSLSDTAGQADMIA